MDKATRCQMLVAMMEQSRALAELSLDPAPLDDVERQLLEEMSTGASTPVGPGMSNDRSTKRRYEPR